MKYRHLIFEAMNPVTDEGAIARFENVLGCKLPDDYKAFLFACNGSGLDYDVRIPFPDGHAEYLSFGFFPFEENGGVETNPHELIQDRQYDDLPDGVLPIGRDGGDSMLYLDLREGCQVLAWVRGLPAWTGKRQEDTFVVLADSFDEYLGLLELSDETVENHIKDFFATPESVAATIEWFDSGSPNWREKFRDLWAEHVPDVPL